MKARPDFSEIPAADVAWAAGLFEGEGSVSTIGRPGQRAARAELHMTDFPVVRRFAEVVGVGRLRTRQDPRPNHKPALSWGVVGHNPVAALLDLFRPWLGDRRIGQFEAALAAAPLTGNKNSKKTHCHRGHPFSGDNLMFDSRGGRKCRTCHRALRRIREARYRAERKARGATT